MKSKGIHEHPLLKLGKDTAKYDARNLRMASIMTAAPPPEEWDFDALHPTPPIPLPMFGNDTYGDCVIAARAHSTLRFEDLEQRKIVQATDKVVENEYFRQSGGEDDGLVMLDSIKLWRTKGWRLKSKTYRIKIFAEVDRTNHTEVKQSIIAKNGIQIGLNLPLSAQSQFENSQTWDVSTGSRGQPGSWGGHCVTVPAYNATGPICVTWAARQQMTWAFWDAMCDEAYWLLDALDRWLKPIPEAPVSIDTTKVEHFLTTVSPVEHDTKEAA